MAEAKKKPTDAELRQRRAVAKLVAHTDLPPNQARHLVKGLEDQELAALERSPNVSAWLRERNDDIADATAKTKAAAEANGDGERKGAKRSKRSSRRE